MKISQMNWMQVEAFLKQDDRCVLPLGSTEQHAYLSLSVDSILAEKMAADAAEPLGIPVYPVLAYGLCPYWLAYPGTVSLRVETYLQVVKDILNSIAGAGFKRILIVNGHGGNSPAAALALEWMAEHTDVKVRFHNWWNAPKTWAKVQALDPEGSHASWMENFPWTRLADIVYPAEKPAQIDSDYMRMLNPQAVREYVGAGSMGGVYERSDDDMLAMWSIAADETRALLTEGW